MGRRVRYAPEGGCLFEVTCRTQQGRFLFRPSPEFNEIALGVLGRAQRLYPVSICGIVLMSNHYHLLVRAPDAGRLAFFMWYLNANLAREVVRLTGWTDKVFSRRYQAIAVSDEEAAQVERLEYLLSHGVKEDLVEHVGDWPGVHCARALIEGEPLQGTWFDRTRASTARRRGETFGKYEHATTETVELDPLPCWNHLPVEEQRRRAASLVRSIDEKAAARRQAARTRPLGALTVLAQAPLHRPERLKKSPVPFVHAATKAMRQLLWEGYALFVAAYRSAAERLKAGDPAPPFPLGCFPPARPFVSG
jgi:putative transposase